jgi:uncharacterized membrane protein (UPF0127 family)
MTAQHHDHPSTIPSVCFLASALVAAAVAVGCSQPTQEVPPPSSPAPQLQTVEPPTGVLPDGTPITVELAITPDELATGLMFRPSLPPDRGMLLLFEDQRRRSIWMKNTLIKLDLIFLDRSGSVVWLEPGVPPCGADPCPTYAPDVDARAVLELAEGMIETHGLVIGDQILFERVPGYPVVEEIKPEETTPEED